MEIILLERVENLGKAGAVVRVKDGFARNYLIPQKKALRATEKNKSYYEQQRVHIEAENAKKLAASEAEAAQINEVFVTVIRQMGEDGRLYGSVSARDIGDALFAIKHKIERHRIQLQQPLKKPGIERVRIALHPDVSAFIHVNIARSEDEAEAAKQLFLNPPAAAPEAPVEGDSGKSEKKEKPKKEKKSTGRKPGKKED
jgi:large subunit ribosomal protein L9